MNQVNQKPMQKNNPAKASSKAMGKRKKKTGLTKEVIQQQALAKATTNTSTSNYEAIIEGFTDMGIDEENILPRENIFTFNAWKALGRVVSKGQRGVKVSTVIECSKKDNETGEETPVKKGRTTTVFHISQTELMQ